MAWVLASLPFFAQPTVLTVGGEQIPVKADQIILWLSLTEKGLAEPDPRTPRFPAVLDTGLSHNVAIREEHLTDWTGLYPPLLEVQGHGRLNGRPVNMLTVKGWIYRNQSGQRDVLLPQPPFPLEMSGGIAVYPAGTPNTPRLPALGLRALRLAKLHLHIDADRCLVSLRTRRWFWFLG